MLMEKIPWRGRRGDTEGRKGGGLGEDIGWTLGAPPTLLSPTSAPAPDLLGVPGASPPPPTPPTPPLLLLLPGQ